MSKQVLLMLGVILLLNSSMLVQALFTSWVGTQGVNPLISNLYPYLCKGEINCVFSPYGLYVGLSTLAEGAEGQTLNELFQVLVVGQNDGQIFLQEIIMALSQPTKEYDLQQAIKIYINFGYLSKLSFQQSIQDKFSADISSLNMQDFPTEARIEINKDINFTTNGHIQEMLPFGSVSSISQLILANALYFKGVWLVEFEVDQVWGMQFFVTPQQSIQVPSMSVESSFRYREREDAILLELPFAILSQTRDEYKNWDLSFVIILPVGSKTMDDLEIESLADEAISMIATTYKEPLIYLSLIMPKFEVEFSSGRLKPVLQQLGVFNMFNPTSADLSGISDQSLYVSEIYQKIKICIDEKGTNSGDSLGIPGRLVQEEIVVDSPFGFMIIYQPAATVLFMGKIGNPSLKN